MTDWYPRKGVCLHEAGIVEVLLLTCASATILKTRYLYFIFLAQDRKSRLMKLMMNDVGSDIQNEVFRMADGGGFSPNGTKRAEHIETKLQSSRISGVLFWSSSMRSKDADI